MMDDTRYLLDDLLMAWHRWARGYQHVGGINTSPMFRECKNGRQWDTVSEIIDSDIEHTRMAAVDHLIMGLLDVYRTALQIQARNLCTGRSVWDSARLPKDPVERQMILVKAREALTIQLQGAGIL